MEKTVNYPTNFWKQLFTYPKNGRYSIDNLIAERFVRLLPGERKNLLSSVVAGWPMCLRHTYADIHLPDEWDIGTRLLKEIFPRNCQRTKRL
ncbi:MAG: IS66 family transposase [Parabacteroides distasonis]